MKRIVLTSAMILGLAATSAFAAQNKNAAKPKTAKAAPAMKSSNSGGSMASSNSGMKSGKKHHRRHHRKSKKS